MRLFAVPPSGFLGKWLRDWGGLLVCGLVVHLAAYHVWLVFPWHNADDRTFLSDLVMLPFSFGATLLTRGHRMSRFE